MELWVTSVLQRIRTAGLEGNWGFHIMHLFSYLKHTNRKTGKEPPFAHIKWNYNSWSFFYNVHIYIFQFLKLRTFLGRIFVAVLWFLIHLVPEEKFSPNIISLNILNLWLKVELLNKRKGPRGIRTKECKSQVEGLGVSCNKTKWELHGRDWKQFHGSRLGESRLVSHPQGILKQTPHFKRGMGWVLDVKGSVSRCGAKQKKHASEQQQSLAHPPSTAAPLAVPVSVSSHQYTRCFTLVPLIRASWSHRAGVFTGAAHGAGQSRITTGELFSFWVKD